MHRITSKDIRIVFANFAKACGKRVAGPWDGSKGPGGGCDGAWALDCNHTCGGWQIIEYIPGSSAETHPMGDRRMTTAEFYHAMHFAMRAMDVAAVRA